MMLRKVSPCDARTDLKPATDLHRLIQTLMGWPEPAYAHHPLLLDADGKRLAKRDNAPTLRTCGPRHCGGRSDRTRGPYQYLNAATSDQECALTASITGEGWLGQSQ